MRYGLEYVAWEPSAELAQGDLALSAVATRLPAAAGTLATTAAALAAAQQLLAQGVRPAAAQLVAPGAAELGSMAIAPAAQARVTSRQTCRPAPCAVPPPMATSTWPPPLCLYL